MNSTDAPTQEGQFSLATIASPRLFLSVIILLVPVLYKFLTYDKRLKHLPPGPKGYPIIGSLLSLRDPDKVPEIAKGWARKYGKIAYTKIGNQRMIWLSTPTAIKDLMEKRGSVYSSRPDLPMAFGAASAARRVVLMPYGDAWRNLRKFSHKMLNFQISNSYRGVQDLESKQVMYDYLHAKNDWEFYDINRRYSTSLIMTITYGKRVKTLDDRMIKDIFTIMDHFAGVTSPGTWLVDTFPSLTKLPSFLVQNWREIAKEWCNFDSEVYLRLYRTLVEEARAGTAKDCYVKDFYLAEPDKNGIDELTAAYAAGSLVEAGSESTSSAINSWLLACLLNPHVVAAAHEELDRVIGDSRMPDFSDEPDLPYIRAMVKETLRWRPITKFGMNHTATEDGWYDGYFIPKNSMVVLNWWGLHFDPARYDDAEAFEPMRYIDDPFSSADGMKGGDPDLRDHYSYGAGRRGCPGIHVAQNSLFVNMARTMWGFNVRKAVGCDGKPTIPSTATSPGFLMIPVRFPAVIEVRSKKHANIIEANWAEMKSKLDD